VSPHVQALSGSVEEYLEAIHRSSATPQGASTTGLAEALGVKPASVTGMLRRLAGLGLISYRRYRTIALTPQGERRAHEIVRRHRLTERLLTDLLGVPLDQVHEHACRLEHGVSPDLETRIAAALGGPQACPHGHPIDAAAGDDTVALVEAPRHRVLIVVRLEDERPEAIRFLSEAGLLPGAQVRLVRREPFAGVVTVQVGDRALALGWQLAASVRVQRRRRGR